MSSGPRGVAALPGNFDEDKQIDPVDIRSKFDPWRADLFAYVSRLVRLRAAHPALARNECSVIHVDMERGFTDHAPTRRHQAAPRAHLPREAKVYVSSF